MSICKEFSTFETELPSNGDYDADAISLLIATLDRLAVGMIKWESRLRQAVAEQESGLHTLAVRIDHGQVRKVSVEVRDEL